MNRPTGKLSPAEFEIMEAVWELGECTITDVMRSVNTSRDSELKRATIQVQLRRLEEKGWLTHEERDRKFLYRATADRGAASAYLAGELTERIFDGSAAELVRCLFEQKKINSKEIGRIRQLLDQLDGSR